MLAEKLCPNYPIGTRRLCLDTGYYETLNRGNVTLVDMRETPVFMHQRLEKGGSK